MGVRIKFNEGEYLKGLSEVQEKIQKKVDELQVKSTKGLADALLFVATESQQRAPVDTGDLRGSVKVEIDSNVYAKGVSKNGITIAGTLPEKAKKGSVSFNTKYAGVQHEQLNYSHPRGGQAKYLESVLLENQDRILKCIADKMRGDE